MARTKIILRGDPIINEEEKALEALIPGHLVMLTSTGLQKNTANAANVARAFALEREEIGKGLGSFVSTAGAAAYAIGDYVKIGVFAGGMRVYAFLASGQNVAKGDYLTTDNAGLVTKTAVAATIRVARALEAVDTSGSAPVAGTRIRIEIV
jgi:hypothetical protein